MDRWIGKVAVVTGSSAGIGAQICKELVHIGVNVVGFARRKEKTEELAKELESQPGKLYAVKVDITKEEEIVDGFKWATENVGPVAILINNAGVLRNTSLIDGDVKMWREVLETNVIGLSIATREAIRSMLSNEIDGHIIHINSLAGHWTFNIPNLNMGGPSKFAVTALAQQLRYEMQNADRKIKITSISPGAVDTEIAKINDMQSLQEYFDISPHLLSTADIADAVIYALSTGPDTLVQELIIRPVLDPKISV